MEFTASRFAIYRALCDHLDTLGQITTATKCFQQMNSELENAVELHTEQAEWVVGECCCIPCRYGRYLTIFR